MSVPVLIGTTNPAKVKRFERLLDGKDVEILTPPMLHISGEPEETGCSPEENARIKARFYGRYCDRVIGNDSGLYFLNLPEGDPRQPGLHVRSPQGARLNDDEMIAYYSALAASLGGRLQAYYRDAVAVSLAGQVSSLTENDQEICHGMFYMVDTPHALRNPGWPLDSLSILPATGRYFADAELKAQACAEQNDATHSGFEKRLWDFLLDALKL